MDGPPLPPGPPPPGHFDDRGGPGGGGHKRGRSPPRGGPPFDRDDRYDGRPPPRSPQRRRFNDGGRGPGRRFPGRRGGRRDDDEPLSFREFTIQHLPDHIAPAEAERAYQRYQETHAEKFRERNFHDVKNDPKLRELHDPRKLNGPFRTRAELAADAAKEFHERLAAGTLEMPKPAEAPPTAPDPPKDDKDDDAGDAPADERRHHRPFPQRPFERRDARGRFPVPPQAWNPTRLAHDLRNLVRLVKSLDEEKGVESAWTESADVKAVLDAPDPTPHLGREPARAAPPPKKSHTDDKGAPAEGADQGADMETDEPAPAQGEEIEGDGTGGVNQDALAEAVDVRIAYLWRVHGVDYYARQELSVADYVLSPPAGRVDAESACLMRAAKPSDPTAWEDDKGDEGKDGDANDEDDAGDKTDGDKTDGEKPDGEKPADAAPDSSGKHQRRRRTAAETWAFHTDRWCVDRVTRGDPEEARLGRARADRDLNAWMDSCIVKHDENRYGCTLSAKLFVSPEYVLKHIKNKQGAAVDAQLDKIYDRIYMENYLAAAKKEDLAAKRQKRQEREERLRDGAGGRGGRSFDGGRGGRGGRGPRDRNQFQRPQISVMQAAPGMMLVPAEGAGPNGPYVQVPAPEAGGDAPEGGQQQVVVVAEGKGGKRYQDIDAPKSNRVVLDYGDI